MSKSKAFWLGVLISIGMLVIVFYETDFGKMAEVFGTANYSFLLPALALYFVGVGFRAGRWHFLLRSIKSVRFFRLFEVTVIGYMVNDVLPLRVGEIVRAVVLGETEQISKASVLVTVVLERVFDGVTMLLLLGAAMLFLPVHANLRALFVVGSVLFAGVIVALVVLAGLRERFDHIIHRLLARLPERWAGRGLRLVDSFFHGLQVMRNPADALAALGLSIIAWLCEAGMYAIIAFGFGLGLPYPVYVLATAVANLVTIIPSTPGYIGVFDAPIKSILTLFGVDPSVAASYTILLHAALIVPVVLLGLVFTWHLGLNFRQLSRQGKVSIETAP